MWQPMETDTQSLNPTYLLIIQEGDSFFQERLNALRELDCTPSFTKFSAEVYSLVQSLPQLVFHKQQIVDLLTTHLKAQTPATASLLE